jgi:hypothetical protein
MEYVELFRVRRSLIWHAGILAAIVICIMALGGNSAIHINGTSGTTTIAPGVSVPISALATIAGFFAAIYASSVGTSLNRESTTRDISWTKPLSRTLLALRYVLIDVAGVVIAFLIALIGTIAVLSYMHVTPVADAQAPAKLVLGAGVGVMWYGLLQLITCGFGPGARAMAGILWPVALVLEGLGELRGSLGAVIRALDVFNPLAYLNNIGSGPADQAEALLGQISYDTRGLMVWFLAAVFCALAIAIWPRREA